MKPRHPDKYFLMELQRYLDTLVTHREPYKLPLYRLLSHYLTHMGNWKPKSTRVQENPTRSKDE